MLSDELLLEIYTDYPEVRQHLASVPIVKKRRFLTQSKLEIERDTRRYLVALKEDEDYYLYPESELLSSEEVATCSINQEVLNGTTLNKLFVRDTTYMGEGMHDKPDSGFSGEAWVTLRHEEIASDRYTDIAMDIQICWPPVTSATLVRFTGAFGERFVLSNTDGICLQQVRDILQTPNGKYLSEGLGREASVELRFIGWIEGHDLDDE